MSTKFIQSQEFRLAASGATIGDTTILLQSMLGIDGTALTTTDIGSLGKATIEPGNGIQEEAIQFTGITQNSDGTATLTGVSHVLFISPYTATSGITKTHAGATTLVLTNTAGFYSKFAALDNTQTFTGVNTFSTLPVSSATPSGATDLTTKTYVDTNFLNKVTASPQTARWCRFQPYSPWLARASCPPRVLRPSGRRTAAV